MEFRGVIDPEVYIIDYKVHDEDIESGMIFAGHRGSYLFSLLGSFSILDKCRFANWTAQGADAVRQDILNCQPKVIVGLGRELMNEFLTTNRSITDMSGEVVDVTIGDQTFKYLVMMSPSYILRRIDDAELALRFSQDLYKAFQITAGEYRDIYAEKTILYAHSFDEFKNIYDNYFIENPRVAYDIETTARPIFMEGGEIIGFSIGNRTAGVYVSCKSLDFEMPKEEVDKVWDFVISEIFEKKDKLIIHNTMYERPYTLYCKGYEIPFEKADDTLVMARMLRNPKETAGLKYQAQKYLHYPDWDADLGSYIHGFQTMVSRVGLGPKKFSGIWNDIHDNGVSIFSIEQESSFNDMSDPDKEEVSGIINYMKSTVVDVYDEYELDNLGKLITEKIIEVVDQGGVIDSVIPYNYIPDRVLCKYGAMDAIATFELCEYFENIMDTESTETVDLHKGYQNWLEHMYVAYIMERNGMYWDENEVRKDEAYLHELATESLRDMLQSELFKPLVLDIVGWKYKPIIFSDYMPQIPQSQGYEVEYLHESEKYIVKKDGKRVSKGNIDNIEIFPAYFEEYEGHVFRMFNEDVSMASSFEELKDIYNPASSTSSDIPRRIIDTPDLQMGGRINNLHTIATSPDFEGVIDQLPAIDQKFLNVATLLCSPKELKAQFGDEWAQKRKEIYQGFCVLYDNYRFNVSTPEIKKVLEEKTPVVIESFDDIGVINLYNAYVVTGMDPDDESTWSPVFRWIIKFRLYKKSQKLISSYIEGSVGRGSVVVVDKEGLQSGKKDLTRKRYWERNIKDDELYLLAAKWSPNTAETGRWRSAMHTVPWGSQVKKYYTSRFKGGITLCPDYSQMEVRTLAAVSHDENMLDLFARGDDFHTQTAASIWQKPAEEVTPAERRFSKTATFSLLYGAAESSFCKNYCNGDEAMAHQIYEGFFRAYPRVKEWVDARHKEVLETGKVSLELSNRFITIGNTYEGIGEENAILRKAQNYPIQSQSADLTGCVIFDIQKYIEENNMKSLIIQYVHDSIEVDVYPYEMLQLITRLKGLLNESPMRRMGLPSKADVAMGKSLGHEIELEEIECNEDFTEGTMVLKGFKDEIEDTVKVWKDAYAEVDILEEDYKEEFISMNELFIVKKAFSPTIGTTRHKGKAKIHVKYY